MSEDFEPLRLAPRRARVAVYVGGPFLWLAAIALVAVVVHRTDAIAKGLVITAIALVAWIPVNVLARLLRLREERRAEE